jgi:hypothetical protein
MPSTGVVETAPTLPGLQREWGQTLGEVFTIGWAGTKGVFQGGLNSLQGVENGLVDLANIPIWAKNKVTGSIDDSWKPWDISTGVLTDESKSNHDISVGFGGFGLSILLGKIPLPKIPIPGGSFTIPAPALTTGGELVSILAEVKPILVAIPGVQIGTLVGTSSAMSAIGPVGGAEPPSADAPSVVPKASTVNGIKASGKFDDTVGSLAEASAAVKKAFPDAVELPPAIAGQPYPSPPPGVKQWFQVHPPEPGVGNNLPHIKYADWTTGKKGTGGSWGHIFFGE